MLALLLAFVPATGFPGEVEVGKIIELSPDKVYLQIQDRLYKVGMVQRLAVEGRPQAWSADDLNEGDLVEVIGGEFDTEYWNAEMVTVFQGEMRKEKMRDLNLTDSDDQSPEKVKTSQPAVLQDGVWRN
jgi:hypothetical protein